MSNIVRKRFKYDYYVSEDQVESLMEIALKKDESVPALIYQALDQYIQREQKACQTK
jgi:predicted transcriptional regulator